jgi:AcrR family transcriptional regulator
MPVSGQEQEAGAPARRGAKARMTRHMLDAAIRLMQGGIIPSVSDVAEAAEVSRATAYRYFPSQAAMVQAVVDEALGPILGWRSRRDDPEARVADLVEHAYPRMLAYEATHRAALSQALGQWTRRQAGTLGDEVPIVRGNRKALLREALQPLRREAGTATFDKLAQSLSLIFGIEAIIVLKDIWRLDDDQVRKVVLWAAHALVRTAVAEAAAHNEARPPRPTKKNAASRPRTKRLVRQTA